jgi:hypothetical protein
MQELGSDAYRLSIWPDYVGTSRLNGQLFLSDIDLVREVDNVAYISPFQIGNVILRISVFAMNSEAPAIFD